MHRSTLCLIAFACLSLASGGAFAEGPPKAGEPEAPAGAGKEPVRPPEGQPQPGMKRIAPVQGQAEPMKPRQGGEKAAEPEARPAPSVPSPAPKAEVPPAKAEGPKPARPNQPTRSAPRLTEVQRTHVTEVIRTVNVRPVHVDFSVNVGVPVPRTVSLVPLPPEIITYVPEYSGFEFFEVPGELVIVDPVTLEIVAVLPI